MTRPRLRVIDAGPGHPAENMAVDEALLRSTGAPATLRLYTWSPAGLSLGYFQPAAPFDEVPGSHVLVRRLTGGGAIYHADELTFSLALDAALLDVPIPESYARIHGAVARALKACGVACTHLAACPPCDTRGETPWCFADPVAQDLLAPSGGKLLGSAQRRLQRPTQRILHHGSLVLRPPAATPFVGSVAESQDPSRIEMPLRAALIAELARALGLDPRPGDLQESERRATARLRSERYADPGFTRRR